jgi:uncharacterized membrane protein YvlD (DUF360 family)
MPVDGEGATGAYGERPVWHVERPRFRPWRVLLALIVSVLALEFAAFLLSGVTVKGRWGALTMALILAILNAIFPPIVAALRLPFTLLLDFVGVLLVNAAVLYYGSRLTSGAYQVDSFGWALLAALVVAAATTVLYAIMGVDDDDAYTLRVVQRVAKRQGTPTRTDVPGIIFLEIDGLATPVLQRAMRDGSAPTLARWLAQGSHRLLEWETDLSAQTGASQAGILLGSNLDVPAFRWVEKENARLMSCSAPADCAEIERRLGGGDGLLAGGGSSRGNLFSGGAGDVILTVSRIEAEKQANPGYRAFFANGFNVSRALVLFAWEVLIEITASARARRRDVRPRMRRGGRYPFLRAALCVVVRDIVVYGVLTDMMRGVPAVYATFSSYDEVAHHSGLERPDTMEALRKVDRQFGRIERARRYAPRPYEIVVLSDHGQTQGATFAQRNGYTLGDLVDSSLGGVGVRAVEGGDEQPDMVGNALHEATGRNKPTRKHANDVRGKKAVVLGSGNLGLVYLMESPMRMSFEEIEHRHPQLIESLRCHPHIGWLLVHSERHGPVVLGPRGLQVLGSGRVVGVDPLAIFGATAAAHLRRSDGFAHVADVVIGSFYDPQLDEGCAFEELISFHGGIGGPQTRPFVLAPSHFDFPATQPIGAAAVGALLRRWRRTVQSVSPARGEAASPSQSGTLSNGAPPVGTGRERPLPPTSRI